MVQGPVWTSILIAEPAERSARSGWLATLSRASWLAWQAVSRIFGRTAALLAPRLPGGVVLQRLHGGLPLAEQRAALAPLDDGRPYTLSFD